MTVVSVIIPCYNHGKYIKNAVNSILNQTYQDFDIIIVDDGSIDQYTKDVFRKELFPKTKIIRIEHVGVSKARNIGIEISEGKYFLTLDADDTFEPEFISKAVKILDTMEDVGVVTCGVKVFGFINGTVYPEGGGVKNFLIKNNACGNSLFRRVCWDEAGGYNENMKDGFEDWDFMLSVTEKGWIVHTISEILFNYRTHLMSRDTIATEKRIELFNQIVMNHRETYIKYFDDFIINNEIEHDRRLNNLRNSIAYKIGEILVFPIRRIRNLWYVWKSKFA